MRYKIVYDKHDRLRVRCGDYAFTKPEAFGIADELSSLPFVYAAEANFRTGGILVSYRHGYRSEVLGHIKNLKKLSLPTADVPPSEKATENFQLSLGRMIGIRILSGFLPSPIRKLRILYHAVKYVAVAIDHLLKFKMDVAVLDGTAIGVSVAGGNFNTAGSIMFLLKLSDLLEEYTRQKTKLALSEQLALHVDTVWLKTESGVVQAPFSSVKISDEVIVHAGNVIPFDGEVCGGEAMINQSTMTGESAPVCRKAGDSVFAGTTVESGSIVISVRSLAEQSRLQEIIDMIDESENLKAGIQSNAEKLADNIVPYSFIGFAAAWLFTKNLQRALSVLMVDFSCAIKLSTPISVISAMREAAEYGITVKGGKYLEAYSKADTIVFDKTGTLTNASPKVIDVVPFNGYEHDYVLKTAACLEEHFPHSVANAVVECAKEKNLLHEEEHAEVEYLVAHGIVTMLHNEKAIIGSAHFVFEDEGISVTSEQQQIIDEKGKGNSSIFLAIGKKLAGMFVIDDPVRDEAIDIIDMLRKNGINRICMLTGDAEAAAKRVADTLSLSMYVSQVLPSHKSEYVKAMQCNNHTVIMVGDGVNDTPALAAADVSVAMCDGSDVAREVADIALCSDSLKGLIILRKLSNSLMERIHSNYRFIVGFNSALIILGVAGIIPATFSALLHNTSTLLISLKSMTKLIDEKENDNPGEIRQA